MGSCLCTNSFSSWNVVLMLSKFEREVFACDRLFLLIFLYHFTHLIIVCGVICIIFYS